MSVGWSPLLTLLNDSLPPTARPSCLHLQIHLTYVSPTEITVSWATGYGNTTQSPVDPNYFTEESGPSSTAYWGTTPGQYDYSMTADAATITRYNQVHATKSAVH